MGSELSGSGVGVFFPHMQLVKPHHCNNHLWQSRVEIEGYSIAYFDRIAAFKAPYRWTSVKGRARMRFIDSLDFSCIYKARMSPALNGSSAIRCFKHSNAIEMHTGITFDFYTGLPHLVKMTTSAWLLRADSGLIEQVGSVIKIIIHQPLPIPCI